MSGDTATTLPSGPSGVVNRLVQHIDWALLGGILLAVAANFLLAARQNVNWDEFNYLTQVHSYLRGELVARMQTFHVHLFGWLPGLSSNEVDQIVGARLVIGIVAAANALLIYVGARRFMDRHAALFGLCAYLAMNFVIGNSIAFRADPMATFLALLACFTVVGKPGRTMGAAIAGAIMAVAMMLTIKSIFYVTAFGLVFLAMGETWRDRFRLGLAFAAAGIPVFALLYGVHAETLATPPDLVPLAGLGPAGSKMFLADGLFPRWPEFLASVAANPILWFACSIGVATLLGAIRRRPERRERRDAWVLLAMTVPVLTPLIYRNAFDYYYVFILPPAAWLAGIAYQRLFSAAMTSARGFAARFLITVVVLQLLFLTAYLARQWPDRTTPQRLTLAGVHQVFPALVAYIDGYGIVASFPSAGFFMSSWGMDSYRAVGRPIFADRVAAAQPPMLLADALALHDALLPGLPVPDNLRLLPEDASFLVDHYLQYWGMLFVAGKQLAVPGGGPLEFTIAVAGDYRLEGAAPVRIDGKSLAPNEVIMLSEGVHLVETDATDSADVRLVWAVAQPAPSQAPVDILTFFGMTSPGPASEPSP